MKKVLFFLLFILASYSPILFAQCTITSNDGVTGNAYSPLTADYYGNSFTACQNGIISKIRVLSADGRASISLNFYEGNGVSGTLMGTKTGIVLSAASAITDYTEINVSSLNLEVINGQQYTFFFNDLTRVFFNANNSMYSGGTYWVDDGGVVEITTRDLYFEIDIDDAVPVPVELTTFTAAVIEEGVQLNWETATEVNNYGFEVERQLTVDSDQLLEWETIAFIEGHGNSNSPKSYEYIDTEVPEGSIEYRLKQIDTDGTYEYYSITAKVDVNITDIDNTKELPSEFALLQNYPNPFNPSTVISYTIGTGQHSAFSKVQLQVFDLLGKEVATLVNKEQAAGYYNVNFDASNLPSGMYIYKLQAGEFTDSKKLMLMK